MKLFLHWIISAIAIGVAAYLIPGVVVTPAGALVGAIVLGLLNLVVRPVLHVLTLPITILTLGLFSLVINAALVWLTSLIVPGFVVGSFLNALIFGIVLALINWIFHAWSEV